MGAVSLRRHLGSGDMDSTNAAVERDLHSATAPAMLGSDTDSSQRAHQGNPRIPREWTNDLPANGKAALLRESLLFRGLSLTECDEIVSRAIEQHFDEGQIVFREGDPVSSVCVLVSGRAKITQMCRTGGEVILRVRGEGEVLGGIGMVPGSAQFVTAQSLEPCTLMVWDSRVFEQLEDRFPALRRNIVRIFAERLHSLEEQFLEIAHEQVAPRLARTFVRLMEQGAGEARDPMRIDLSRDELAQMTGTTPFTVGRLLSAWEERGIVQIQRKALTIRDHSGLISLAQARERAQ